MVMPFFQVHTFRRWTAEMWITFVDKCVSLVKMDEKRDRHANDTRRTNGTDNVHKSCENVDNPLRRVFHNMWIHCGKVCTGGQSIK